MRSTKNHNVLSVKGITKKFPGVVALDDVTMSLAAGKVTAVIGENGAGKSTLMKVVSGIYQDYEGTIKLEDKTVRFKNPKEAQDMGIAIIHQELNLIPYLTIAENVFLGREITSRFGLLDLENMHRRTSEILNKLRLDASPKTLIAELKVGQQQLVEIAKALLFDARVIIMDEPTSAISDSEIEILFNILQELKKEGKAIVYISHKLDELMTIADDYYVLRDGKLADYGSMIDMTKNKIINRMVGRDVELMSRQSNRARQKSTLLNVQSLCLQHPEISEIKLVDNVSFGLAKGEILGIFGLMGAGRTELLECIFGLHPGLLSGTISINGNAVIIKSPEQAIKSGIGLVPEDRKKDGLIPELDVTSNISLSSLSSIQSAGILQRRKELSMSDEYISSMGIKCASSQQKAGTLSGGNQQKVILSKWLATDPNILLLDEPTRGIDVNAKSEIYKLIMQLASEGLGIIIASSELPEVLGISDRILVMSEGKITAEFTAEEATEEDIMEKAIPQNT